MPRAPKKPAASPRRRVVTLDPDGLLRSAAAGSAPPVVLLAGLDLFSRDAVVDELRRRLVPEGLEAFNAAVLSGEEVSGAQLADRARMLPMGGAARLILVRRAGRIRERELEPILAYAAEPVDSTCLVLVFDEAKGAVLTALKKTAPLVEFPAPRDYQIPRWLEMQARRLGLSFEPAAVRRLAEQAGDDYIGAMSELQRAALLAGGRITVRSIEELSARGRDANAFHLADAVLAGEPERAVRILRDLHDAGTTGYEIIGALAAQLRRYLRMRAAMSQGTPARAVVQSSSPMLPPDVKARIARQLETHDEPRLIEAFRRLRRADRAIKSHGSGNDLAHMEALVWRISAR